MRVGRGGRIIGVGIKRRGLPDFMRRRWEDLKMGRVKVERSIGTLEVLEVCS